MHSYDPDFYSYINAGSARSANAVIPTLLELLPIAISSVLDVGCGAGVWLSVWKSRGCEVMGLDGNYVAPGMLMIDPAEFMAHDLAGAFTLGRRFHLVQCLEVAEHLPASVAPLLVESLCRHADLVLFSAAPPGQGGEYHVNEQPYAYWRDLFLVRGFTMYDPLRARILHDAGVEPWYRYNTFLYVRTDGMQRVHAALESSRVPVAERPRDLSPWVYRLRKRLVALLPVQTATWIAGGKQRLFNVLGKF